LVSLILVSLPAAASGGVVALRSSGYVDIGFDADDRAIDPTSPTAQDPDIFSTTRRVQPRPRGGSWLVVGIRTYEFMVGYWAFRVQLDTRGDPDADFIMRLVDNGAGVVKCQVRRVNTWPWRRGIYWAESYTSSGDQTKCRVPLLWVWPTKRIRWNVSSPPGFEGEPGVWEFAPGKGGWYPS
jgi:hypothetical protein